MKALLIIDMQTALVNAQTHMFESEEVIRRINILSGRFRQKGDKVVFIQHDGTNEGFCIPFTKEWDILPALQVHAQDLKISKTANDSFYKTDLKKHLEELEVKELVVTGCATDFCVDATIKSALTQDFTVTVIANGHTTEDRTALTAKQLINHYNWVWREMAQTRSKIKVIDFDTYSVAE